MDADGCVKEFIPAIENEIPFLRGNIDSIYDLSSEAVAKKFHEKIRRSVRSKSISTFESWVELPEGCVYVSRLITPYKDNLVAIFIIPVCPFACQEDLIDEEDNRIIPDDFNSACVISG